MLHLWRYTCNRPTRTVDICNRQARTDTCLTKVEQKTTRIRVWWNATGTLIVFLLSPRQLSTDPNRIHMQKKRVRFHRAQVLKAVVSAACKVAAGLSKWPSSDNRTKFRLALSAVQVASGEPSAAQLREREREVQSSSFQ